MRCGTLVNAVMAAFDPDQVSHTGNAQCATGRACESVGASPTTEDARPWSEPEDSASECIDLKTEDGTSWMRARQATVPYRSAFDSTLLLDSHPSSSLLESPTLISKYHSEVIHHIGTNRDPPLRLCGTSLYYGPLSSTLLTPEVSGSIPT